MHQGRVLSLRKYPQYSLLMWHETECLDGTYVCAVKTWKRILRKPMGNPVVLL